MHVAVFFDAPHFEDYPFTKTEYRKAYHDLGADLERRGGVFSIVRGQGSYLGGHRFRGIWRYASNAFVRMEGDHRFDRIFNKGHFRGDPGIDVINDPTLEEICTNKWRTYEIFEKHCPHTELVESHEELSGVAAYFASCVRIVGKPRDGEEGRGIVIGTPEEICHANFEFPMIIQEFMDTSAGIPGIEVRMHDFRMNIVNGKIVLAFCRTPPPGGYLANVAQGGSIIVVPLKEIPEGARRIAQEVDAILDRFPHRVYSIDTARLSNGLWRIIELNAKPALFGRERGEDFVRFQETIADLLLSP